MYNAFKRKIKEKENLENNNNNLFTKIFVFVF